LDNVAIVTKNHQEVETHYTHTHTQDTTSISGVTIVTGTHGTIPVGSYNLQHIVE